MSLTIRFGSERELRERLRQVLSLFDEPSTLVSAEAHARALTRAATASDSCISLFPAIDIVTRALSPKQFVPAQKLGVTYVTPQERELFRARVVRGVRDRACQISLSDVPSGESTTHGDVVSAVRQKAH